ncbi:MAG: AAC(3) family N-acetyltransferase [Alphaproteobacteria bacterium]|nr:AAC(3) family N-acetyltransferase [Alphaproteobacteria bacterium]
MIRTSRSDLVNLWRRVGIGSGMLVLCHSFLGAFGRIEGGPDSLIDTLIDAIEPGGTLVVPAFTYSFFKGETYDPSTTPSTVGILGDALRRRNGVVRSLDPNFSNVAIGRMTNELMRWSNPASFGADSFYARLLQPDGQVLLLGVDYTALPLFMHLEWQLQVSYRYEKAFAGHIVRSGELRRAQAIHYVRDERVAPQTDRRRIGVLIDADNSVRRANCAYGLIRAFPARTVERIVRREVAKNPLILLDADRPFLATSEL